MLARTKDGKPKGKICILHYLNDLALVIGAQQNWENRLGQRGAGKYKWYNGKWYGDRAKEYMRDEIWNHYENRDCANDSMKDGNWHSYQFEKFAIMYYNKKFVEIKSDE